MSLDTIFAIASSGMSAETTRLSTSASNLSNANVVAGNPADVYQAQYPIFQTVQEQASAWMNDQVKAGVQVTGIYTSTAEPVASYQPNHPLADGDGMVYSPAVNYAEEMANVISASRAYQMNIEMMDTAKKLMQRTLQLGQ